PEAAFDAPEGDRLLVAAELGRRVGRDVAGLQRTPLVPDRDRVRVVLVLGLRDEREPPAGVERRILDRFRPERDSRDGDHADALVLPRDELARGRVSHPDAGAGPLEPEPQAVAHRIAPSARTACTPLTPFTTCVTRRSATTLASASASSAASPCSREISATIPSVAIRAASSRSSSKPKASQR